MILLIALFMIILIIISKRLESSFQFRRNRQNFFLIGIFFTIFIIFFFSYDSFRIYVPVFLSLITLFIFHLGYHKNIQDYVRIIQQQKKEFKDSMASFHEFKEKEEEIQNEIVYLTRQLEQTSSVYKSTLEMSSTLDFKETLFSFLKSLSRFEGFKQCYLIINTLSESEDLKEELTAFFLSKELKQYQQYPAGKTEEVLFLRLNGEKKIHPVSDSLSFGLIPKSFSIDENNKAYIVPLYFQDEYSGGLVYFNEKDTYLEQLELLSFHFSMEIHKSKLYEKIKYLSTIDQLSGVYLKRHFLPLFEDLIVRHKESDQELSVIITDIDEFKQVNDKYGHLTGDKIIRQTARVIKSRCREEDLVGRYGGDEFIIVLPRAKKDKALAIAERIQKCIEDQQFFAESQEEFKVGISIGVASYPHEGKTSKKLIEAADRILFKVKEERKNSQKAIE